MLDLTWNSRQENVLFDLNTMESNSPTVILVTGGTGLVGSAIKRHVEKNRIEQEYNEKWIFLSSSDGDLRDRAETFALFDKYKPTYVIHLAAFVGGLFKNMRQKVEFYRFVK